MCRGLSHHTPGPSLSPGVGTLSLLLLVVTLFVCVPVRPSSLVRVHYYCMYTYRPPFHPLHEQCVAQRLAGWLWLCGKTASAPPPCMQRCASLPTIFLLVVPFFFFYVHSVLCVVSSSGRQQPCGHCALPYLCAHVCVHNNPTGPLLHWCTGLFCTQMYVVHQPLRAYNPLHVVVRGCVC